MRKPPRVGPIGGQRWLIDGTVKERVHTESSANEKPEGNPEREAERRVQWVRDHIGLVSIYPGYKRAEPRRRELLSFVPRESVSALL